MPNATTCLKVAAVQFRSGDCLSGNLERIGEHLARLAHQGVRVAAFPECAATSYDKAVIPTIGEDQLREAEARLATECRRAGIYAVVGIPYFEDGRRYNGALVWNPEGACIARYAKIQLAGEDWCEAGERFALFHIDDVLCSVIICHDERYPELVRLPVLAGAQLVFYISCESDITAESKIDPYRAQIRARAVENTIYVVQSNAPMGPVVVENGKVRGTSAASNGHSRIIRPDGNLIAEASMFGEDVLVAELDMSAATRGLAEQSLQCSLLRTWWEAGLKLVAPPAQA